MASPVESSGLDVEKNPVENTQVSDTDSDISAGWKKFANLEVELRGVQPVSLENRHDNHPINLLSFWSTAGLTLLAITTGIVGTLYMGLSLTAASLVILFFTLLSAIPPAAFSILGPLTGMRQIVQARYSFGRYAVMIVAILNVATATGWSIVSTILAGQTLSAVSGGGLSWNVGIVIMALIGMFISFMGYKVLHHYERWAWIPALIAIVIATGCGGHLLKNQAPTEPVKASSVMSFACVVISFTVTWTTMASDFCVYMKPDIPKWKPVGYTYFGLTVPIIPLMVLGAAIGGAIPSIPEWGTAMDAGLTGGVMLEMMRSVGGFGKFVTVIIAFTPLGNLAGTLYSISIQLQVLTPFFYRIPRYAFSVVITAIIIGVAIPISKTLFISLENFLGCISYWAGVYVGVITIEHLVFRKAKAANYDPGIWNDGNKLPLGIAAVAAAAIPFGLIVPCMAQNWYTGPIARTTGDIGFLVGLPLSMILYFVFRTFEIRFAGR